ncbi:hypothetical protein FQA47_019165 [Oryzias melastigma]|uniref:Uncharacterized protein n=1 Tax=Oryzias melastigma TaxID=30732 RepID=A0A834C8K7_ORYME|nr:hypothetical protein FQA47_019165 [Oryzias melastigma]
MQMNRQEFRNFRGFVKAPFSSGPACARAHSEPPDSFGPACQKPLHHLLLSPERTEPGVQNRESRTRSAGPRVQIRES